MTVLVTCACCGATTAFPALIYRDGYEAGPQVAICPPCDTLPVAIVWQRIAQPSTHPCAFKPIHPIREALPTIAEVRARA